MDSEQPHLKSNNPYNYNKECLSIYQESNPERDKNILEKRFFLLNYIKNPVILTDNNLKILMANEAILNFLNVDFNEVRNKNLFSVNLFLDEQQKMIENFFSKIRKEKKNKTFEIQCLDKNRKKIPFEVDVKKINVDGTQSILIVLKNLLPNKKIERLLADSNKELHQVLLSKSKELTKTNKKLRKEISKRKKKEADLDMHKKHFETLFNMMVDPVVIVDKKGKFLEVTDRVHEITGFQKMELLGKNFFKTKIVTDRSKIILIKKLAERMLGKNVGPYEVEILTKDKQILPFEVNAAKILYKDKPADMVVFRDLSERKKAEVKLRRKKEELDAMNQELVAMNEELMASNEKLRSNEEYLKMMNRELNVYKEQVTTLNKELESKVEDRTSEVKKLLRQKDDFIHQLSHDLKTPLAPILSILPFLEEDIKDQKSKEALHVVLRSTEYMKKLVHSTLELARLNSPTHKLEYTQVNLADEVDAVIDTNSVALKENNISVHAEITNDICLIADKIKLDEVLNNLVSNSIKYTQDEKGSITISAEPLEDDDSVLILVKDTGMGMDEAQVEKVFDEFYKADESRHAMDSSGLGLPICKRIVEKHGGRIWAESPGLGKGSTIYFTIPRSKKNC